jgi:Flp pilus assembly protein TadG
LWSARLRSSLFPRVRRTNFSLCFSCVTDFSLSALTSIVGARLRSSLFLRVRRTNFSLRNSCVTHFGVHPRSSLRFLELCKRRGAHSRGAVSMQLLVIMVPVLFGLMGFAVDLGRLYLIRGELNQAANAMAMAAAQNLNGTGGSLEIAALAANQTIDPSLGDANQYNFGSLVIGNTTGTLSSTVAAPLFFGAVSDAIDPTSTNYADGTTARYAQINLQADAPLLFWSLLTLGQNQKTTVGAMAVAGISAPLCTVCSMEDFAVADQSGGSDPVDFGFVFNTKYTFFFDCTGAPGTSTALIPDATVAIPYVMIDRFNPNIALDETQQLFRTGDGGLIPLPMSTANRTFACFTVGAAEFLWGNAGNGGTSTVPGPCGTATVNAQVEQMLCGIYGRFDDPNVLTGCSSITSLSDISTAYQPDTDLADYDDYTAYGGNGRRIITVPIVDVLSTAGATTMNVLGFRQFFVTPTPNPNTSLGNDPTDVHGKFNAIYLGNVAPVKQGFYYSLVPPASTAACSITSGPGKVVLNQ